MVHLLHLCLYSWLQFYGFLSIKLRLFSSHLFQTNLIRVPLVHLGVSNCVVLIFKTFLSASILHGKPADVTYQFVNWFFCLFEEWFLFSFSVILSLMRECLFGILFVGTSNTGWTVTPVIEGIGVLLLENLIRACLGIPAKCDADYTLLYLPIVKKSPCTFCLLSSCLTCLLVGLFMYIQEREWIPAPGLLRCSWHITLYWFKVCNIIIWCMYILRNG